MYRGHVDGRSAVRIYGWAWDQGRQRPTSVSLVFPDGSSEKITTTVARPDVEQAIKGALLCGFNYSFPDKAVRYGPYRVLFEDGTPLLNGEFLISPESVKQDVEGRWRADEPESGLTWGVMMTGDSFVDFMQRNGLQIAVPSRYVEVGPGYGRILKTLRDRWTMVSAYAGIELSKSRVDRLSEEFSDKRFTFYQGSCDELVVSHVFDILFCSSTFEHLYPDFTVALRNLRQWLRPGGTMFIDFICIDDEMKTSSAGFGYGAFVRIYSIDEIRRLFLECHATVKNTEIIMFGDSAIGPIRRIAVAAKFD